MGPQDFESWGLFFGPDRRSGMAAEETKHYLRTGRRTKPAPREALEWAGETQAQMVDLKFCDLLGTWQHVTLPITRVRRVRVRRGARLRRLLDPRLAGDRGVGHAPDAGRGERDPRSVHRGADALARSARSPTRSRASRTARTRAGSRGAPRSTCARPASPTRPTSGPSASSSSSTRSRTSSAERGALQGRLGGGPLELRRAGPRLHGPREAGLLPAGAARHAARPAHARWC